jgi:hypothetical protein
LPLDCNPNATGASSYLVLNCLAISLALWHGMRALLGASAHRVARQMHRRQTARLK